MTGFITATCHLPRSPFPLRVTESVRMLVEAPDRPLDSPYVLVGKPIVQVATHPRSSHEIELVWELNDVVPYDGQRYRSHTAAFADYGQEQLLSGKTFEITASLDGQTFVQIATIDGPVNRFVHRNLPPNVLIHYKVLVRNESGRLLAASPVVPGAAGKNLMLLASHEDLPVGPIRNDHDYGVRIVTTVNDSYEVVTGSRPYSDGQRVIVVDPKKVSVKQTNLYSNFIDVSGQKTYLQGGWVRAPGNIWYGRQFYDATKTNLSWGYVAPAVRQTPEWQFVAQRLLLDVDGTGTRRDPSGRAHSMSLHQWTFPPEAAYMTLMVVSFGPGNVDDHWLIELTDAPEDYVLEQAGP